MERVVMCDVCIEFCAEECDCLSECACYDVEPATHAVQMLDEHGKPVAAPVCERHFKAAARVRIKYEIAPKLPLVLPEKEPAEFGAQWVEERETH